MRGIVSMNTKLSQAKIALASAKIFVDLIKCCGGKIKPVGSIAAPILRTIKTSVDKAHSQLNPFVRNKLEGGWKLQQKLDDVRRYNNNARTKVEKVDDTFHHYAYPWLRGKSAQSPRPSRQPPHKILMNATDGGSSLGQLCS